MWARPALAASYRHRPQHPPETFEILSGLIADTPRTVLDLGCGTGYIARPLAPLVDRIDAVDLSAEMVAEARGLPGGDDPRITWIVGRAEEVELDPPYALVTAGDSLHWMDWTVVLPRLGRMLSPNGRLAILDVNGEVVGETEEFRARQEELKDRYATYRPPRVRLIQEIERRGFFREEGRAETKAVPLRQSVDEYVESFHAHMALSRDRMDPRDGAAFDAALRQLVLDHIGETVELAVRGLVLYGRPLPRLPKKSS